MPAPAAVRAPGAVGPRPPARPAPRRRARRGAPPPRGALARRRLRDGALTELRGRRRRLRRLGFRAAGVGARRHRRHRQRADDGRGGRRRGRATGRERRPPRRSRRDGGAAAVAAAGSLLDDARRAGPFLLLGRLLGRGGGARPWPAPPSARDLAGFLLFALLVGDGSARACQLCFCFSASTCCRSVSSSDGIVVPAAASGLHALQRCSFTELVRRLAPRRDYIALPARERL